MFGTPIYAGYNLLVILRLVPSTNYTTDTIAWALTIAWVAIGAYHFIFPIRSNSDMLFRLISYHGVSLATIVLVTGFVEPFASSIALLFLASNIYFGRIALACSMASVVVVAIIDAIVRYPFDHNIVWNDALGAGGILILGFAMTWVIIAQETRRHALMKSQEKEQLQYNRVLTIMNNLTDATFTINKRGNILLFNAAALSLLDTNKNLQGVAMATLLNLTDDKGNKVRLHEVLDAAKIATKRDDLRHVYHDGEEIRLAITVAPIKSGFGDHHKNELSEGYILILSDITKAKSLEEERDEFISVVSHELRTPITIMEGTLSNLQLMMQEKIKAKPGALLQATKVAHDQSIYLAKMVNDLSTLSRAERGVADTGEDIDIMELLHKMHDEYEKAARAKKLHLNLDLEPSLGTVHTSRLYLEELLQNFITNAIKYTPEGSVTIHAGVTKNNVTISVKDTGIGIGRTDQQKIFQKFYRSEDYRTRETSGTGLGLYVAQKLAHKVGTKIVMTSRLNHGSTFSFTLPLIEKK